MAHREPNARGGSSADRANEARALSVWGRVRVPASGWLPAGSFPPLPSRVGPRDARSRPRTAADPARFGMFQHLFCPTCVCQRTRLRVVAGVFSLGGQAAAVRTASSKLWQRKTLCGGGRDKPQGVAAGAMDGGEVLFRDEVRAARIRAHARSAHGHLRKAAPGLHFFACFASGILCLRCDAAPRVAARPWECGLRHRRWLGFSRREPALGSRVRTMRGRLAGGSWAPSANCPHESARVASTQIRGRADAPLAATAGSHCWQPLLPLSQRPSCRSSRLLSSTSPALLLLAAGCCPACLACLPAYLPGLPACLRTCVPARAHTGGHPAACGAVHG